MPLDNPESLFVLRCPVHDTALKDPGRPALVTPGEVISYAELDRRVATVESNLKRMKVQPGERVALYLPNELRYPVLIWALLRVGAVVCPLSTRLPLQSVAKQLKQINCRCLITSSVVSRSDAEIQCIEPTMLEVPVQYPTDSLPEFDLNAPATILFTSGSSGRPKAAMHTFGNHYYSAIGSNNNLPVSETTRWLLVLPLYHVGGLAVVFRCFLHGGAVVMPDSTRQIGEALLDFQVTHASLVATQFQRLMDAPLRVNTLEAVLLGGSALPSRLLQQAYAAGLPVYTSYGSTEMTSQITTTPPGADPDTLLTAGYVLPHRAVRIDEEGQIQVRGATRFQGYVEGDRIQTPFDEQGWFATGDRGRFDAAFRLHVEGRMDHMFISGGENIQPEEIEAALRRLSGIVDAVVVPIPDPEFGSRPVAFVQSADGVMEPQYWIDSLEKTLPRFKIPRLYHPWPKDITPAMKLDRSIFQQLALNHV